MTKKLYKSFKDKAVFGVCGGLAEYFNVDSLVVRLLFVAFSLAYGSGVLIYLIMALVVPKNPESINAAYTTSSETQSQNETEQQPFEYETMSYSEYKDSPKSGSYSAGGNNQAPFENNGQSAPFESSTSGAPKNKNLLGAILVAIGVIIILKEFFPVIKGSFLFAGAAIILGVYLIVRKK